MKKSFLLIFLAAILLAGCSDNSYDDSYYDSSSSYNNSVDDVADTYEDSDGYSEYWCTDDCWWHDAWYNWAEENDIEDPDDCDGNSDSFIEWCQAYAEEVQSYYESENSDEGDY